MEWRKGQDMLAVMRDEECGAIAFTANAVVTKALRLVMGGGAALDVRSYFHGNDTEADIDLMIGARLASNEFFATVASDDPEGEIGKWKGGVVDDYHIIAVPHSGKTVLAVQVKRHFTDRKGSDIADPDALLHLMHRSLKELASWCARNPEIRVVMNCPLVGLGGYDKNPDKVYTVVEEELKDSNVLVTLI